MSRSFTTFLDDLADVLMSLTMLLLVSFCAFLFWVTIRVEPMLREEDDLMNRGFYNPVEIHNLPFYHVYDVSLFPSAYSCTIRVRLNNDERWVLDDPESRKVLGSRDLNIQVVEQLSHKLGLAQCFVY